MELQVMTFNLRLNTSKDGNHAWPYRVDKVVKMIEQYTPAVVGTQEALPSMISDLEGKLSGYNWVGEPRRVNDEYCAIFYHKTVVKLVKQGTYWLSEQPSVPESMSWNSSLPRICTWAEFEWIHQPEKKFRVVNTHLDHRSAQAREKGIHLIWEWMNRANARNQLPTVLMGDFNAEPESRPVQFPRLESGLIDSFSKSLAVQPIGRTFHHFEGGQSGHPIDYIFVSKNIKVVAAKIDRTKVDGGFPSDHYPVIASLEF
jgi:endonuclease/exonuclease/phosphatase family metal-dependent hydrolase